MRALELIAAAILVLGGLRSLARWVRRDFDASSVGEQVLFALHAASRVGTWFALAGFFVGYALASEPGRVTWYVLVPICLGGIQFLTGVLLARTPRAPSTPPGAAGDE